MYQRFLLILAVMAVTAAACSTASGSDPTTTTTAPVAAFPVTIDADNGPVTIEAMPERIVSISPTSTEVLFAIGAGDQVVAVDSQSNHPSNTPITDIEAFLPSVEAIASYDPDLVFLSYDPGDVVAGLVAIGIPVVVHGTAFSLDAAFAQWEQTGAATGHVSEAVALVADTTNRLQSAADRVPEGISATYYYELDDTYYTATSASFVGQVIAPTGLSNIADAAPDPDGFGYPQLATEYIVDADPTLILLADTKCCGQSASTVAARPGWGVMTAVNGGGVVALDDDIASRWGPRVADLLESIVDALLALESVDA